MGVDGRGVNTNVFATKSLKSHWGLIKLLQGTECRDWPMPRDNLEGARQGVAQIASQIGTKSFCTRPKRHLNVHAMGVMITA